jgi:periplasmic divalent cation tolerance protein
MTDAMIVLVTCGSREEAGKIAEALVADRLAACVNILPAVESCYRWEGSVKWNSELLLVIKTTADSIERAHDRVVDLHSYDVPEFVAFSIETGSAPYLKWIAESVS